jgi:anthranilate phosphoribosyltransferase
LSCGSVAKYHFPDAALAVSGTGGKIRSLINVSSLASLLASLANCQIVKTGSRSSSAERLGTVDIFERLGFVSGKAATRDDMERHGIAFLRSTDVYPWLGYLSLVAEYFESSARFERVLFGMDRNESNCTKRLIGTVEWDVGSFLRNFSVKTASRVWVFAGRFGEDVVLDEASISGPTRLVMYERGNITNLEFYPPSFALPHYPLEDILISSKAEAAQCLCDLLEGRAIRDGWRDLILMNACVIQCAADGDFSDLPARTAKLRSIYERQFSGYLRRLVRDHSRTEYANNL